MKSKAIEKIQGEMTKQNNTYVKTIGSFLIYYLEKHPEDAMKIIDDNKSITKSIEAMRKVAEKQVVANVAVLTDEEGFNVVLDYFGLSNRIGAPRNEVEFEPAEKSKVVFDVKLDDLLK